MAHSCNLKGEWGAGIALALKERFYNSYLEQKELCSEPSISFGLCLGDYHLTKEDGFNIISLFTSVGYGKNKSSKGIILRSTRESLISLFRETEIDHLYIPKINSGYFGVPWESTEKVLLEVLELSPGKKITVRTF